MTNTEQRAAELCKRCMCHGHSLSLSPGTLSTSLSGPPRTPIPRQAAALHDFPAPKCVTGARCASCASTTGTPMWRNQHVPWPHAVTFTSGACPGPTMVPPTLQDRWQPRGCQLSLQSLVRLLRCAPCPLQDASQEPAALAAQAWAA